MNKLPKLPTEQTSDTKVSNKNTNTTKGNKTMNNKNTKQEIIKEILILSHLLSESTLKGYTKKVLLSHYEDLVIKEEECNTITYDMVMYNPTKEKGYLHSSKHNLVYNFDDIHTLHKYISDKNLKMINETEIKSPHDYDDTLIKYTLIKSPKKVLNNKIKLNTKKVQTKINNTPLIDLKGIVKFNPMILATNESMNKQATVLFATIKESKEIIKVHKAIIATSYDKLIPLINTAIKSKKLIYPNMSNKNLLKLIKSDFDTKDTLVNNSFYLKDLNITLPFGVNKNQIIFLVKNNKSKLISNNSLKNLTLETLETLINATKVILKEIADTKVYESVKAKKDAIIVDVEIVA